MGGLQVTALDTNILVRYVMRDNARQVLLADRLIDGAKADGHTLYISSVVLCELVWVLRSVYKSTRDEIASVLGALGETAIFRLENADEAGAAQRLYAKGPGDFADYLIQQVAAGAGCTTVATFDHGLRSSEGFNVLT